MSSKYPPVKNSAYTFRVYLFAQDDNQIQQTVTLAAGDFQSSGDGGAFGNLATLPSESPAGSGQILVSLSAGEMNYDEVTVRAIDAAGAEWHSAAWVIHTVGQTLDTIDALIDTLVARLTADRAGYLDKLNVSGTLAHSDAADTYKADVSGLALEATAQAVLEDTVEIGAAGAGLTALGDTRLANLDATVSSRLSTAGYTAPPAAAAVADAVWDEATAGHATAGSTGAALTAAGNAGDPWATTLPGGYTGDQAGNMLDRIESQLLTAGAALVSVITDGDSITAIRGDEFSLSFTSLGSVSGRSKLWFTVKTRTSHGDDDAMIQIAESGGLLFIAGAAAETAANGSLTVTDQNDGDMTITLDAAETAKMPADRALYYDVQVLGSGGVQTLTAGRITFTADVTRATS